MGGSILSVGIGDDEFENRILSGEYYMNNSAVYGKLSGNKYQITDTSSNTLNRFIQLKREIEKITQK